MIMQKTIKERGKKMKLLSTIRVKLLYIVSDHLRLPPTETLEGDGACEKIGDYCKKKGYTHALVVTDKEIMKLGVPCNMLTSLKQAGIAYTIYDGVLPNPTLRMSQEASMMGKKNKADIIIAFGGGSSIDCAKLTAATITNTKPIKKLIGILKVRKEPVPIIAVPTTAGTGSEISVGAVISDDATHKKSLMISPKIVPALAVLDGRTMVGLPPYLTAITGFDALTHAVEAFIGRHRHQEGKAHAKQAVVGIYRHLKRAFDTGSDIEARSALSLASYHAGKAMNKCGLGYAHAFGHRLTEFYDLPHGLAVGMVLPHVLDMSRKESQKSLSELAIACKLGDASEPERHLAEKFISWVSGLYRECGLPQKVDKLSRSDYHLIIKEAFQEADATYPVPRYFTKNDAYDLLDRLSP